MVMDDLMDKRLDGGRWENALHKWIILNPTIECH
jgi:hypothetical protein